MADAEPGAMFDSAGSKRSTANRFGAVGSAGGAVGMGLGELPGAGVADGSAAGVAEDVGVGVALG